MAFQLRCCRRPNSPPGFDVPCSAERVIVDAGSDFTFFFPRLGGPEEAEAKRTQTSAAEVLVDQDGVV